MKIAEALASSQDVTVNPDGDCELAGVSLPGLPEGLLVVAFKRIEEGEFGFTGQGIIGGPLGMGPLFIIKPDKGWVFKYDMTRAIYNPARAFDEPKDILIRFRVKDTVQEVAIRRLSADPLFVQFED